MASPIINIKFLADLAQFSKQMQNANRRLTNYGKQMQKVGATLSVGLTAPLLAYSANAINAFDKQAKAVAQVEAGLLSTGNAVGFTTDQLKAQASALQNNSLFGDEEILQGVTAQLLTFTNVSGEAFSRTQQAALDLSTRLDGDLKSSAIQLGKALNDPVANLSALSRSGIQFSNEQKTLINSLVQTNRLAEAQDIILTELEKQYGGSAAAAAAAGKGPLTQLGNIIGDISEEFGEIIIEGIKPFVAQLKDMAIGFQNLSPVTKKWIVILGGVAAAIGPLLALAGTILPLIATGFAALTGPIGLTVASLAAVGTVIYKNWEPIKQTLVDIANYFIDLYNESLVFRIGVQGVTVAFKQLFEVGKFLFESLKTYLSAFKDTFVSGFTDIGRIIKAVLTGDLKALPGIIQDAGKNGLNNWSAFTSGISDNWSTMWQNMQTNTNTAIDNVSKRKKIAFLKSNVDASAITEAVNDATSPDKLNPVVGGGQSSASITADISAEAPEVFDIADLENTLIADGQRIRDAIENIAGDNLFSSITDQYDGFIEETQSNLVTRSVELFNEFNEGISNIINGAAENFAIGFGELLAGFATGTASVQTIAQLFLGTIADMAIQLGKLAISIGIAVTGIKAALQSLNPAVAIAAGIALVALGSLVKSAVSNIGNNVPKFAEGGVVGGSSLYGDKILARVNSQELILNTDQQKRLYGMLDHSGNVGGFGELKTVIKGDEIQVVLDRASKSRNRRS